MNAPFPFVGAGAAQYFEFASVEVVFRRAPTKPERTAIVRRLPAPLQAFVEWKGPLLEVVSQQRVAASIRASFKGSVARFNAAIDAWLAAAHTVVPIRVALRTPDDEAGGTTYSAWHHESIAMVPQLLATLSTMAVKTPALANVALGLVDAGRAAKQPLPAVTKGLLAARKRHEAQRARDARLAQTKRERQAAAVSARAAKAVSARPDFSTLARALPKTAARLDAATDVTVRPGATRAALERLAASADVTLDPAHRALLECFDGGRVGAVEFLSADEVMAFANAHVAPLVGHAVAHTAKRFAITHEGRNDFAMRNLKRAFSAKGFKSLDAALDAALKKGRVFDPS